MNFKSIKGFTLTELIFVIIIISVLTALAVPRFQSAVEYSRSMEAFMQMGAVRQSLDRCHFLAGGSYANCDLAGLDIKDPSNDPRAHFSYTLSDLDIETYTITALRNSIDKGDEASTIVLERTTTTIRRYGTGIYEKIK